MKNRIKELDALRGLAAVSVVLFHFTFKKDIAVYGFNLGCMGVDLFFIISGFVIFLTIEKTNSWKDFVVSRFSRLYPAYWACLTLTTIAIIISYLFGFYHSEHFDNLFLNYLFNLTMFQYYFKIEDMDGSYWTLIIELNFYILMLLILILKKTRHLEYVGIVLLCFMGLFNFKFIENQYFFFTTRKAIPLLVYFPLFFSGILIYKMKFEKISFYRFFLLVMCFSVQVSLFNHGYRNHESMSYFQYILMLAFIYSLFIIYIMAKLSFIVNPLTSKLGEISYSLYLIHQYIGVHMMMPFLINVYKLNIWLALTIALVLIIALSIAINSVIEKPALKFIRTNYFGAKP